VRVRTPALACALYALVTAILGRHVLAAIGTSIANDAGDPLLTAAILHWNAHHLPLADAWWQFPIFYPTRDALAFSEHLLGISIIASPISWLTGNSLTTYNLTLLLTFPLCALSMYALVYQLTGNAPGAFIAGLAYGFGPYRTASLAHIQMLASFWAPIALLGLHRCIEVSRLSMAHLPAGETVPHAGRARSLWLAVFGAGWALQALANGYMLLFFSVFVALWVFWFVIVPRRWRAFGAIAATTTLALVPLVPILYKYVTVHSQHNFARSAIEVRVFSADVAAVFCAPPSLTFWGWVRVACRAEGELFPGVTVAVLFVIGLVMFLRRPAVFPRTALSRSGSLVVWVIRVMLAVAIVCVAIVAAVFVVGPLHVDLRFFQFTSTHVTKPLLVAIASAVLALAVSLVSRSSRQSPPVLGFYLLAAVMTWLFALGPLLTLMGEESGRPGPFAWLQWLPGADGLRVPARFWLLTVLSLSVVAGISMARLSQRLRPAAFRAAMILAAGGLLADGWMSGIPARELPAEVPDARSLRDQVVIHVPADPANDAAATWQAVIGGWKSVNGVSGYAPNYYFALTRASRTGEAFTPFRRGHDLYVIAGTQRERLRAIRDDAPPTVGVPVVVALHSPCAPDNLHLALDRNQRTQWQCSMRDRQELTADLGAPATINGVVYSLGPYWWNAPDRLVVATSVDGVAWEDVRTGGILAALIEGGIRDPKTLSGTLTFAPRQARYVRLRGEADTAEFLFVVSEIEIRASEQSRPTSAP
jgi:hypothetical protein